MILEDQIKQAIEELTEARAHLKMVRPATALMKRDLHRIGVKENKLEISLLRYNQLTAGNKALRMEIDVTRKEQRNQLRVNKGLIREMQEAADEARKVCLLAQSGSRVTEETNNQILALKANHEERKVRFEYQIKGLQDRLKEKDDVVTN